VNIAPWIDIGGGFDRLLFAANPGRTTTDLRFVRFTNDPGINFATGGTLIDSNASYELAPMTVVPEPATWIGSGLALLALVLRRAYRTRRIGTLRAALAGTAA
jgi:hypothetical protein